MKYKFLEHTADIKFQAFGKTIEEAFENSALAMFNSMYTQKVNREIKKKISVIGKNYENLLYNFLEELLFLLDSEGFFLSKCNIKIKKKEMKLDAELFGDKAEKYSIGLDVKAITYNSMKIEKIKNRWTITAVIDV